MTGILDLLGVGILDIFPGETRAGLGLGEAKFFGGILLLLGLLWTGLTILAPLAGEFGTLAEEEEVLVFLIFGLLSSMDRLI